MYKHFFAVCRLKISTIRFHVILAPKFASAWEKGRIMVGIEIEVEKLRKYAIDC